MEWRPFDLLVISANGLKNVNYFTTMDVYVEVSIIGYAKNVKRTFIDKKGGTSPKWNHPMKFTLDEPSLTKPALTLSFRIRSDRFFGDKDIGIVTIPINEIFLQSGSGPDGSPEKLMDYQVLTPVAGKPMGILKFSYNFGKKYGQPQSNGVYPENKYIDMPPPAYPSVGMGYGTFNSNPGMAYQQPTGGVYPPVSQGGYPQNPPVGYPQNAPVGYGYPPQQAVYSPQPQGQGLYPQVQQVQKPQKKSKFGGMGAGLGLGLAGGLLGGVALGEMASHGDEDDAYEQGYDDAMDDMDY